MNTKHEMEKQDGKYFVRIIRRDGFGQINDDYLGSATRFTDGETLHYVARFRWMVRWMTRTKALDRAFKRHEKRMQKLIEEEIRYR